MIYYVHKIKYRAVKKTVLMNRSFVTAWSEKAVIGMLIRLRKKQVISIYWGRLFFVLFTFIVFVVACVTE